QQQALDSTASRLRDQGQAAQVTLVYRGHEHLLDEIPATDHEHIQAVMFNLGYLPHGDIITVLAYRGHPGGQEEAQDVERQLQRLAGEGLQLSVIPSPGPVLFVLAPERYD
ncbi:class I SAM-dependent methyltransferase, partial [Thiolapillus sp.]|uniref:class I SAM-dependent methyltransferase n=1 Tax=Thiolapillus sp. TaxID=2017437 RepID=UPI0025E92816